MGRSATTIEQAGRGQHISAQTKPNKRGAAGVGGHQRIEQCGWRWLIGVTPARHDHRLRLLQRFQSVVDLQRKPRCGAQESWLGCAHLDTVSLLSRAFLTEYQARHRQVERADLVKGNNCDSMRLHD